MNRKRCSHFAYRLYFCLKIEFHRSLLLSSEKLPDNLRLIFICMYIRISKIFIYVHSLLAAVTIEA